MTKDGKLSKTEKGFAYLLWFSFLVLISGFFMVVGYKLMATIL